MARLVAVLLALAVVTASGTALEHKANPIRKVVNMLRDMMKKVEEEGDAEKDMYSKFKCYCKSSTGDLQASITAAETKVPQLGSDIESSEAAKKKLDEDVKQAKEERAAAKVSIQDATAVREKEAKAYETLAGDYSANIAAIKKAVAVLEQGVSGASFLQSAGAATLRKLVVSTSHLYEDDRATLNAFLSTEQDSDYAPQSGEIIGILKQLGESMAKSFADADSVEKKAVKDFEALIVAEKKEIAALTAAIESKMTRSAQLGVTVANMKNDLSETEAALEADKTFIADLDKECKTKTAEWYEISKTRQEELTALSDTIKILNDDDALDLFKQTLPSAAASAASFFQVKMNAGVKAQALALIESSSKRSHGAHKNQLAAIAAALRGKAEGFEMVVGMIDEMVDILKKEQADDLQKKEYCLAQFDESDDKKKALERSIADTETAIANSEEGLKAVTQDIADLQKEVKTLDKETAERTEQRKSENALFKKIMQEDGAAKELLAVAKNRLNEFYNPKLHMTTRPPALSREDQIYSNLGGEVTTAAPGGIADTGVTVFMQVGSDSDSSDADDDGKAPPPAPETPGPYSKKMEESSGVIAMIDLLVKDLDKEMTQLKADEENAQADYDEFMQDAAETRAEKSKELTEKVGVKASLEAELLSLQDTKDQASTELSATVKYIGELHAECDWLLQNFDARGQARDGEVSALGDAKAVLNGADYSFLQMASARRLRGSQ